MLTRREAAAAIGATALVYRSGRGVRSGGYNPETAAAAARLGRHAAL